MNKTKLFLIIKKTTVHCVFTEYEIHTSVFPPPGKLENSNIVRTRILSELTLQLNWHYRVFMTG